MMTYRELLKTLSDEDLHEMFSAYYSERQNKSAWNDAKKVLPQDGDIVLAFITSPDSNRYAICYIDPNGKWAEYGTPLWANEKLNVKAWFPFQHFKGWFD